MKAILRGRRIAVSAIATTALLAAGGGAWTASAADDAIAAQQDQAIQSVEITDTQLENAMAEFEKCLTENGAPDGISEGIVVEDSIAGNEATTEPKEPTEADLQAWAASEPNKEEMAALDKAFEACEPSLEKAMPELAEATLDPNVEATLLKCLTENGAPDGISEGIVVEGSIAGNEATTEPKEPTEGNLKAWEAAEPNKEEMAALDKAFEACEPVLGDV